MTHKKRKHKPKLPRGTEFTDLPVQESTNLINAVSAEVRSGNPNLAISGLNRLWRNRNLINDIGSIFHVMVWYAARQASGPVMQFLIRKISMATRPETESREIMVLALIKTARQTRETNPMAAEYLRLAANRLPNDPRSRHNLTVAANCLQSHPANTNRAPRQLPRAIVRTPEKSR